MLSVSQIIKALRVPELKYEISNNEETSALIDGIGELLTEHASAGSTVSLISTLDSSSQTFGLSPRLYNALFLCDRLSDVFYRKSTLDESLRNELGGWRFALARILIYFPGLLESQESPLLALFDEICVSQIGWTPQPRRVSQNLLDRLSEVHRALLKTSSASAGPFITLKEQWQTEQQSQRRRLGNLFDRLVKTEQGAATSKYSIEYSRHTLHRLIKERALPVDVANFLVIQWQEVLRRTLLSRGKKAEWIDREKLTARFVAIFSAHSNSKKEALYQAAEGLVDEMAAAARAEGVEIGNDCWESIQRQLILVLQGAATDRATITLEEPGINFEPSNQPTDEERAELIGQWFLLEEAGVTHRLRFGKYFSDARQILWMNHAGLKSMLMSWERFNRLSAEGFIKRIPPSYLFSQVFKETVQGLGKVAKAQHDARKRARIKAEAEAEQLRLAKIEALEKKHQEAQEAAKLMEEQKLKRAEKLRLEQEQGFLNIIAGLGLGSWISVGSEEKYKLAVKINATDKLIFVDRVGLKKFEIKTPELMNRMITGEVRVLSKSAEFDDTLSRVVGRIRVGK